MKSKMISKISLGLAAVLFAGLMLTSCSKESESIDTVSVENYVDQSVFNFQAEGNVGKFGCFEFVFPLTIAFPDGSTTDAEDYESLRSTIKSWIEDHADELDLPERDSTRRNRHGYLADIPWDKLPSLVFPIEVISEDGEVSSLADQRELLQLKRECRKDFFEGRGRHNHHRGDRCFKLVFPITLVLEDGSTITGTDGKDLKMQVREWKASNPDATERPTLQFPVTVQLEDESTQEVASKEDLQALKETCSAE
jgi:hypothetical protein